MGIRAEQHTPMFVGLAQLLHHFKSHNLLLNVMESAIIKGKATADGC